MRRWTGWIATVVFVSAFFASEGAQAAGFANSAQSATSTAMGGVGFANPDEPNASYYNPAIMSQNEGFTAYVGPTFIVPSSTFESATGEGSAETKGAFFPPPNGHVGYRIDENWSAGLGVTLPYGLGITWPDEWVGRETIQSQQLQTLNINPNVAYKIPGTDLTLAAGGQVVFSSIELRRRIIMRSDKEIQSHLGGTGYGFGGTAGVLFQPVEGLSLGASYRSAVRLDYDGVAHFENEEGTPFEDRFVDGDVTTNLTLPHTVGVGLGWQLDRLFLEVDVQYTTWHTYDRVVIDFEKDRPSESSTVVSEWRDAAAIRFGAEYEVVDRLPLRLGLAMDQTPIPEETFSPSLPGNDRAIGSFGAGYTLDNGIRFDAAYQLVSALARDVSNETSPDGTYQTTAHLVGINVGYGY